MQENLNSSSTSDNSIRKNNIALKKKVNNLLKQEIISENDSLDFFNEIRTNPNFKLELEKKEKILCIDNLEIVKKQNINPVFLLNLINVITVVNFAWSCTKNNVEKFHKILLKLNIMFSFHKEMKEIIKMVLIMLCYHQYLLFIMNILLNME